MPEASRYFLDILVLLLAAIVVVPTFQAVRIPTVLGYLVAGMIIGPRVLGLVSDVEETRLIAEFGVVFLLFAIGLDLPLSRLQAMRRFIFGLGVLQVVVTATAVALVGYGLGLPAEVALVVGITLAFSSTATVLKMLVERGEALSRYGRAAIAVLVFQDLAVVPVLTLLPLLSGSAASIPEALALAALKGAAAILAIVLIGRFLVRPAYHFIAASKAPEVFTAANIFIVLAVGWGTAQAGMSMALGAFLAGLLLADTAYRHEVEADIEPFRGLFLGLFFMTVGMAIDLRLMVAEAGTVAGLTLGLVTVKAALLLLLCRVVGLAMPTALRVALLLAQGGEFAFVVFGKAVGLGLLAPAVEQTLLAVVALSMALTPALGAAGNALARLYEHRWGREQFQVETGDLKRHVVIAGYGRVGRAIARILTAHGIAYVALDLNAHRVAAARRWNLPVYFGDASKVGVLRAAGIERARAAVITLNRPLAAEHAVACIRRLTPDLKVIVRSHDVSQHPALEAAGATAVVPETMEASLQMAGVMLRTMGMATEVVDRSLDDFRRNDYELLADRPPASAPAPAERPQAG